MSACSVLERISVLGDNAAMEFVSPKRSSLVIPNPVQNPGGPGPGPGGGGPGGGGPGGDCLNGMDDVLLPLSASGVPVLEKDYYGCYCLKFIVKNGTHITEEKVQEDFSHFGEVVDVRGPGLFSGLRGNHVYVRFIERGEAEEALRQLATKYHQLTPASISDVLPDNYGLYTISFYNKTGIPSADVRREFSKFGEVKNLTGSLDVKGGRVFVSYKEKTSAVQALQAFFFRKDKYPNMKFALPRCEKDYFGCYCLKFYNKSGDITEEKVNRDFGQFGEVVDVRGPGLFDVTGDDVYVRYKEKSSAEQALIELVGKYDSLCLAPPSDIQADKFGYFTITFVNDKCLSKSDVWYIFSKFGTVACVNGTFDCKKGRVFVSYKEKQGALNALETMLITKEYHLQVSKNSTVRKNDYNVVNSKDPDNEFDFPSLGGRGSNDRQGFGLHQPPPPHGHPHHHHQHHEANRSREASLVPNGPPSGMGNNDAGGTNGVIGNGNSGGGGKPNGMVKFNRNVEKDIFGYFCLSFLNEDGDISEKKVRTDFGKFGEVVSVRGALGKQKGHVFVRFRKREAAENCLNCLNSFPLSEMSELFGKYLFLSPATPRDIDCDMYGLYSISFLNLNMKTFREIRQEFSKFGEIVRLTSGGGGNTDELVSISYAEKNAAVLALQTHFTNKEFPYLDIAKGSSLLLVNSSDSSDNEENETSDIQHHLRELHRTRLPHGHHPDPFHDPSPTKNGANGPDVVDELLKPFQSYFHIYRTGQYHSPLGGLGGMGGHGHHALGGLGAAAGDGNLSAGGMPYANGHSPHRSPDKKYRIKSVKTPNGASPPHAPNSRAQRHHQHNNHHHQHHGGNSYHSKGASFPPLPPSLVQHVVPPVLVQQQQTAPAADSGKSAPVAEAELSAKDEETELRSHASTPPTSASSAQSSPERDCVRQDEQQQQAMIPAVVKEIDPQSEEEALHNHFVEAAEEAPSSSSNEPIRIREDLLGYYTLSFCNRSKDLTERKIKLDFGRAGLGLSDDCDADSAASAVARIRGLGGLNKCEIGSGEIVLVSFSSQEAADRAVNCPCLRSKYSRLSAAPRTTFRRDKDGYFSVDFINSGMSGIREITNHFSRFGEVMKVMSSGGAKNAVKRMTVSFGDVASAVEAVKASANSKDFLCLDVTRECCELSAEAASA